MLRLSQLRERYPQIKLVYDTKMAEFHDQQELLYDANYQWLTKDEHIQHYHVNDYAGGYMEWSRLQTLPIGRGKVDFDRFFAFVRESGYRGTFTVEGAAFDQTGEVDIDMLNQCFRRIRQEME
jgi:sugar phosphate isomerase/epimerase